MKNDTNPIRECAGSADEGARCAELGLLEQHAERFMDRTQILRAIKDAYGSGRSIESVMRECMSLSRAGSEGRQHPMMLTDFEYGRSVYRKRRCGKVASFFRCLLR